jgi:hypothetical protein
LDKGHLIDHVNASLEGVADSFHPLHERFVGVTPGHLVDRPTLVLKIQETVVLVGGTLGDEKIRQGSKGPRLNY